MNLTLLPTNRNVQTWEEPTRKEILLKLREVQTEILSIRKHIQKDREWLAGTIQTLSEHNPHTGYSSDQLDPHTLEAILRQSYQRVLQVEQRLRKFSANTHSIKHAGMPANFQPMRKNLAR